MRRYMLLVRIGSVGSEVTAMSRTSSSTTPTTHTTTAPTPLPVRVRPPQNTHHPTPHPSKHSKYPTQTQQHHPFAHKFGEGDGSAIRSW